MRYGNFWWGLRYVLLLAAAFLLAFHFSRSVDRAAEDYARALQQELQETRVEKQGEYYVETN